MVKEGPQATYRFLQSTPKVHSGFRQAGQVSGLKQQVLDFIGANYSAGTAGTVNVLLTGKQIALNHPLWVIVLKICGSVRKHR